MTQTTLEEVASMCDAVATLEHKLRREEFKSHCYRNALKILTEKTHNV